ncbi:tyrosine-type recombinase/integrase [Thalassotalea euphylliae]|nr:tyrosine-type recombinase/integrase [Thalassotalea euphylliae]
MTKGCNPNHPKKGTSTKVQPIRSLHAIAQIKRRLANQPRNLCLFTLGINTAYRANELLSLTIGQVEHLQVGDVLDIKQSKNSRYRATAINQMVYDALQNWLAQHPKRLQPDARLFMSRHYRHEALTVSAVNQLIKQWCFDAGLRENYGSHSLRKTWGYQQRMKNKASVALLMRAYGHVSEAQTLDYLGILADEIHQLYFDLEL